MNAKHKYTVSSEMAAAYTDQQMHDREAGNLNLASYCQDRAEWYAKRAREYAHEWAMELNGR